MSQNAFENSLYYKMTLVVMILYVCLVVPESVIFISDDCFNDCPEVTLYVAEGSVGEKYAVDKGLTYQYY